MDIFLRVLSYVVLAYLLLLIGRLIISWIQNFSRSWTPSGIVLVIAEACYSATDPPLRLLRRYIPSPRIGTLAFDLSFMLLFLVVLVLWQVLQQYS